MLQSINLSCSTRNLRAAIAACLLLMVYNSGWTQEEREVGVRDSLANSIYRQQQRPATCWAACNSMLLAAEDIDSDEEDQIKRMSRIIPDWGLRGAGAHFEFASKALGGIYGDRRVGVWFRDRRYPGHARGMNREFVEILGRGQPCMVATPQHGMVAIGVRFQSFPDGQIQILAVEVLDPNPGSGGRRWLPQFELLQVFGFMAVRN